MSSFLRPGLTATEASDICMHQCRAGCCRGPLVLTLDVAEISTFQAQAADLGVPADVTRSPDGGGWLKFADHPGECCPMLDPVTYACRIYDARPQRCRNFPEKPTPGCAISGG